MLKPSPWSVGIPIGPRRFAPITRSCYFLSSVRALLEEAFRARKQPVGPSWRMDETYLRVKGLWMYLYQAVDEAGAAVDLLLTTKRDRKAGLGFLREAIKWNGRLTRSRSTRAVLIRPPGSRALSR
jgi:hypothetical protein